MRYNVIVLTMLLLILPATILAQDAPSAVPNTVVSVIEYPNLQAGIARSAAFLAPDGLSFAHIKETQICIYVLPEQKPAWCGRAEDGDNRTVDLDEVRWSPDSRYLSFSTNDFLRTLRDPDLWVVDVEARTVTNITPDGAAKVPLIDPDESWPLVDLSPRWLADSNRLLFLRVPRRADGENEWPGLYTIAPDGSDLQQVGTLETDHPISVYALDTSPDGTQLVFNYLSTDDDFRDRIGVWVSSLDGSEPRQILRTEVAFLPGAVSFSRDAAQVLSFSPGYAAQRVENILPEHSATRLIDVASAEEILIDETHYVYSAGWSPTGHALAYLVRVQDPDDAATGLYITTAPGESGQLVYNGFFIIPTLYQYPAITWAQNDTLLLAHARDRSIVVLQLGRADSQ